MASDTSRRPIQPLAPDLVDLLRCPLSGQPLRLASEAELATLARHGHPCPEGALVRGDTRYAYPVRDSFPVMLADQAIPMPAPDQA